MIRITVKQVSYANSVLTCKVGFAHQNPVRVCTDGKWHELSLEEFCVCQIKRDNMSFTPDAGKEHLPFCMGDSEVYDRTVDLVRAYHSAKEGKEAFAWVGNKE